MSADEKRGFFARFRWRSEPPAETVAPPIADESSAAPAADEEPRERWYDRLRSGLSRSSNRLKDNIGAIFTRRRLDAASLEELEEALITADLGV